MAKIKVPIWGTTGKSVLLNPLATVGATIGVDLHMPDGSVATLATLAAALNLSTSNNAVVSSGSIAGQAHSLLGSLTTGDDHTQYALRSILTTRGDLYVEGASALARLAIGSNHQVLMSNGTDPVWTTLLANPTANVGLTIVNGTANTAMRSDGAPALDVGIIPTWTAQHTFNVVPLVGAVKVVLESRQVIAGSGLNGGGALTGDVTLTLDHSVFATVAFSGAYADLSGRPADLSALTFLTVADETGTVANARRLLAGNEVAFDDAAAGIRTINLPHVFYGAGPPGISAPLGSLFLASNGTTVNDRAFINTDGASAWTAITTVT